MMDTRETLIAAKALIADPKDWCQGTYENAEGQHCAVGAVGVATMAVRQYPDRALSCLREVVGRQEGGIVGYNDSHDHECVMQMFDAAIAKCQ